MTPPCIDCGGEIDRPGHVKRCLKCYRKKEQERCGIGVLPEPRNFWGYRRYSQFIQEYLHEPEQSEQYIGEEPMRPNICGWRTPRQIKFG